MSFFSKNSISKFDWQYISCGVILISVFICTDVLRIFAKENLYYLPRIISNQPFRIFSSILIHKNSNHLLSNLGGIIMIRYFLMKLELKSSKFFLKFILLSVFINFLTIWIIERILFNFFEIIPNYASCGFSGIIYAFFGFLLLSSYYGKSYFLNSYIYLKKNNEIHEILKIICSISLIFSFLPGISLIGHLSGFIAGLLIFII